MCSIPFQLKIYIFVNERMERRVERRDRTRGETVEDERILYCAISRSIVLFDMSLVIHEVAFCLFPSLPW
jgi:hypothetical protein